MRSMLKRGVVLAFVILSHAGALGAAAFWAPTAPVETVAPVLSGMLLAAAPAEVVTAPEPVSPPPEPKPVQPAPKPRPVPVPQKPAPKPLPKPVVAVPPSEKAISVPEPQPPVVPSKPQSVPVSQVTERQVDAASAPVQPPRVDASARNNPAPRYPALSRSRREEGVVVLALLITADGRVADLQIHTSSGHPRLDRAALDAVKRWRYEPARRGGQPIEYRYLQPVRFSLNK